MAASALATRASPVVSSRGSETSASARRICCVPATKRVLMVVGRVSWRIRSADATPRPAKAASISSAAVSSPVSAIRVTFPPNAATLRATLPAPPSMAVSLWMRRTGTGASGEIRATSPVMNRSSMTSPTQRTRADAILETNSMRSLLMPSQVPTPIPRRHRASDPA